jgi:hypothetical protein
MPADDATIIYKTWIFLCFLTIYSRDDSIGNVTVNILIMSL